jgi:hypothetical protein
MKVFLKVLISLLVLVLLAVSLTYIVESRFYTVGKLIFPVYLALDRAAGIIGRESEKTEDTIVYCDYYTWHDQYQWERGYSNIPILGFYNSLDPDVINSHSEWAKAYGIDVLKIEYIPQFDETITEGILKADLGETSLCLMYDSRLRFESIGYDAPPYDFSNEEIAETFLSDMDHIAELYFDSNNYFKINGRPVLWIYIARDFEGNYKDVIEKARKNISEKGYDVYLVGDVVFWNYRLGTISAYDAISCYSAYAGRPDNTAEFAERLKLLYTTWKVASILYGKDFIPAGIPAYDDTCLSNERICIQPLSGTADDFRYQLAVISQFLDPVNIKPQIDQVTIATFNEHQEGSSVEPAEEWGFERIEQIPAVFDYK